MSLYLLHGFPNFLCTHYFWPDLPHLLVNPNITSPVQILKGCVWGKMHTCGDGACIWNLKYPSQKILPWRLSLCIGAYWNSCKICHFLGFLLSLWPSHTTHFYTKGRTLKSLSAEMDGFFRFLLWDNAAWRNCPPTVGAYSFLDIFFEILEEYILTQMFTDFLIFLTICWFCNPVTE